ncbi:hypothetical protein CEN49_20705 [Fischerella thermalis CCMEE 5273]|nr:hypothetical protein CEN49_20705 [Fischerella thermalis CCMEE 5273]
MKVWLLQSKLDAGFQSIQLVNYKEYYYKYLMHIQKKGSIEDEWCKLKVYTIDSDGVKSDFPHFWAKAYLPVFSEKALDVVSDLTHGNIEALPLDHPEHKYYAIHVLNTLDAIDYNHSTIKMIKSGLRVGFKKYAFIPSKIIGQHIFRVYLDDSPESEVFVSDAFKERVASSSLVGYEFIEVWDSEKEDSDQPFFHSGVV